MIEPKLLELHFSQLYFAWSKSKLNRYSDSKKEEFHRNLGSLIQKVSELNFNEMIDDDLQLTKETLDFVFKSLEFLDKSTLNSFPLEIVECLNIALSDWLKDDQYIIVTSLNNNLLSYSMEYSKQINDPLLVYIFKNYNIKFNHSLIQINLPKILSKDYLANVVLYHELGHFVDLEYKISEAIAFKFCQIMTRHIPVNDIEENDLNSYFPYFFDNSLSYENRMILIKNHLGEYFSDIFAAQYIGNCSNYYINYITSPYTDKLSGSHPSTDNRIRLVNSFINNEHNYVLDILKEATLSIISGKEIKARYKKITSKDIYSLLPVKIYHKNDLSSLLILGWEIWQRYNNNFEKKNNMSFNLQPSKRYEIINNLIEKSISNFLIERDWLKAK